jgi:hypothetical protein
VLGVRVLGVSDVGPCGERKAPTAAAAKANEDENDYRDQEPPLSRSPLRFRHERIEREGEAWAMHRHSAIIASTTAYRQAAGSGSFRNTVQGDSPRLRGR